MLSCVLFFHGLGYNSDIICLQEVDRKHLELYFRPMFADFGFQTEGLMKSHQKIPHDWHSEEEANAGYIIYSSTSLL